MSEPGRHDGGEGRGGDREEVDRRFREIVAGLDQELRPGGPGGEPGPRTHPGGPDPHARPGEQRPRPEQRSHPEERPRPEERSHPEEPRDHPAAPPPRPTRHLGPGTPEGMATDHRSYEPPEEDDHFVPPRPDPLPAGDLHFWAILVGLVVGPLLIFVSAVLPVLPRPWTGVGALLTLVGFVLLVLRQPRRRRHDGDWGARV